MLVRRRRGLLRLAGEAAVVGIMPPADISNITAMVQVSAARARNHQALAKKCRPMCTAAYQHATTITGLFLSLHFCDGVRRCSGGDYAPLLTSHVVQVSAHVLDGSPLVF